MYLHENAYFHFSNAGMYKENSFSPKKNKIRLAYKDLLRAEHNYKKYGEQTGSRSEASLKI